MTTDLPLPPLRTWLLADPTTRLPALVGCTLDDAVTDREWLVDEVTPTATSATLHLLDIDDEDGEHTATRDLRRLSADASLLLPDDLPEPQRALLLSSLGPPPSPLDAATNDMLEAMGLHPAALGGGTWPRQVARLAWQAESGDRVDRRALHAVHERLRTLALHGPAAQLMEAVAVDDPDPHTRAVARFYAATHRRDLGQARRSLALSEPLARGHRQVRQLSAKLLAAVLLQRAACHVDLGEWREADKALRWSYGMEQSEAARALFQRIEREQR